MQGAARAETTNDILSRMSHPYELSSLLTMCFPTKVPVRGRKRTHKHNQ